MEGRFVADYVELWWELLMRRPQEEEGRNFTPPLQLLEDKQHFGGEDCNIPKIYTSSKWNIIVCFITR